MRLLLLLLLLSFPTQAETPGSIIIGDFMSYTDVPAYTVPTRNGWQLALKEINAAGGVLGRPVKIISRDDRGTPSDAIQVVQDLINRYDTRLIMGGFQSHIGAAISNLAEKEGFLFGSPWSGGEHMLWRDGHDLVFRIQPPPQTYGAILAEAASREDKQKWVTVSPDYEGGHGFTNSFVEPLLANNPDYKLINQYWPPLDKIDAGATVQAVRRDAPEAIFTHLYGSDLAAFINEGNKRELLQDKLVVSVIAAWQESLSALGEYYPQGWISIGYPADDIDDPAHAKFVDAYYEAYQELPTFGALHGYILMKFYAAAIERAGCTDPYQVAKAVRGLEIETPVGPMKIRDIDGQASMGMWVGKTAIKDSKPDFIDYQYMSGEHFVPSDEWILEQRTK